MSFKFKEICVLLSRLEDVETRNPPPLPKEKPRIYKEGVVRWFNGHRRAINALDVDDTVAFLSTLLPGWRTDRVYGIQAPSLSRLLGRVLGLSHSRMPELQAYKTPGAGDLGQCLERVLERNGPPATPPVMLGDVDELLTNLAGGCRFSGPGMSRLPPGSSEAKDKLLQRVLLRCNPVEGKWLARLILKDLRPIRADDTLLLQSYHFLLPDLLRLQQDFQAVVSMLKNELREFHDSPDPRSQVTFRKQAGAKMRPVVGTKISRPIHHKAQGKFDRCLNMMKDGLWVLERKYDGEYCEIHVDLRRDANPTDCIQIFSKSGKDSTADRKGIHHTLVQSLRLGKKDCKFKQQAILLGELVVFSDEEDRIMPFEEIRKHVSRSGTFIGTNKDSPPKAHEHLAIVFFDVLLLDNEVIMNKPVDERRLWLRETYKKMHGRAIGAEWKVVDLSNPLARHHILQQFAASNARRCEGLVIKPCGVPYFSMEAHPADYMHSYIKLKKDYLEGCGDEEDFAVIGASYDAKLASTAPAKTFIKWTTFHLGCLVNKEDVVKRNSRPVFRYVGAIDHEHCIPKAILETANILGNLVAQPFSHFTAPKSFDVEDPHSSMSVILDKPLVFEVLGSGYVTPPDCKYLMLRHPRVKKLHEDRTWLDCVSFQELQANGRISREKPVDSESQETRRWIDKLERQGKRKLEQERRASPRSTGMMTPDRSEVDSSPMASLASGRRAMSDVVNDPSPTPDASTVPNFKASVSIGVRHHHQNTKASLESLRSDCNRQKRVYLDVERHSLEHRPSRPTNSPLSEITNIANAGARQAITPPVHSTKISLGSKAISMPHKQPGSHSQALSQAARERSALRCEHSTKCLFTSATLYLTPCISQTPYVTENLLESHSAIETRQLAHWDRASFSHIHLTQTVSESQSHKGLRKIVLVEHKRPRQVRETVQRVLELNGAALKERIEVWDWRVLEKCTEHGTGADKLKSFLIGATLFDDTQKIAFFVGEKNWEGV